MKKYKLLFVFLLWGVVFNGLVANAQIRWRSKWVSFDQNRKLIYQADEKGNVIPDFSRVGYHEGEDPPVIQVVAELAPEEGDDKARIQAAINRIAARLPDNHGFRGCLLLKAGVYKVSDQITIASSGIVVRGEGNDEQGTVIVATGKKQYSLFKVQGEGRRKEIAGSRQLIEMSFVPVGTTKIVVSRGSAFNVDDDVVVFRPGSSNWISDLKMDQIPPRKDGRRVSQWKASSYDLHYERKITEIKGDTLFVDNPIVMEMEDKYGGGEVYRYCFKGRVAQCGIENLMMKSVYETPSDESHAWDAVKIDRAVHCWVRNVKALYFGFSAVNIASTSKNISVLKCSCLESKSIITGSRRYSFSCNGQLNLFKNCEASEGRHDFVTGSRVCGPNVFTQCKASNVYGDIGPHHRWATGTLYDGIKTDGEINVQDRGNLGSGQGWAGVTQVLWNCEVGSASVQSPWVSGRNFSIALKGVKKEGRWSDRPDGEWEGNNKIGLQPILLYEAQLSDRLGVKTIIEP